MLKEIAPTCTVDDAIEYARQVVAGKITACIAVRDQCRMFCDDLDKNQNDAGFRWHFSRDKAARAMTESGVWAI